VLGAGVIAYGPDGLTQPLTNLLSAAYQGNSVTVGGPMNGAGQILAQVIIGQSRRLVRLTPAQACTTACIRVSSLMIRAKFVQDPQDPGHCTPGEQAYNQTRVSLKVTGENGTPRRGVVVSGRFLDDYWTNAPVSGTSNNQGVVTFNYQGMCGVGAIAFLVDGAVKGRLVLDRTTGVLSGWAIPQ